MNLLTLITQTLHDNPEIVKDCMDKDTHPITNEPLDDE